MYGIRGSQENVENIHREQVSPKNLSACQLFVLSAEGLNECLRCTVQYQEKSSDLCISLVGVSCQLAEQKESLFRLLLKDFRAQQRRRNRRGFWNCGSSCSPPGPERCWCSSWWFLCPYTTKKSHFRQERGLCCACCWC